MSGILQEPLLRPDEAGRLLGLPRSTVYELVRRGVLPHVRIGRHLRFARRDLEAWVQRETRGGA